MELNFNSVEMSSKPNAEASSLDYAEAPLTFNSVETIPVLNASAAFKTDSGKVFKEDVDIVPTIIDKSLSYIPWGADNSMPYHIIDLIESDETLITCQMFNAEVCYGSGRSTTPNRVAALSNRRSRTSCSTTIRLVATWRFAWCASPMMTALNMCKTSTSAS